MMTITEAVEFIIYEQGDIQGALDFLQGGEVLATYSVSGEYDDAQEETESLHEEFSELGDTLRAYDSEFIIEFFKAMNVESFLSEEYIRQFSTGETEQSFFDFLKMTERNAKMLRE